MNKDAQFCPCYFKLSYFEIRKTSLLLIVLFILLFRISPIHSQVPYLLRSSLGNAGLSVSIMPNGNKYYIQQSIGQGSAIGSFYKNGFVLRQGFIQPSKSHSNTKRCNQLDAILYPNPATENMTITLSDPINGPLTISLFDICGKKLCTQIFQVTQEIKLNYQPLVAGIYIVEISSGNRFFSTKLIKE